MVESYISNACGVGQGSLSIDRLLIWDMCVYRIKRYAYDQFLQIPADSEMNRIYIPTYVYTAYAKYVYVKRTHVYQ